MALETYREVKFRQSSRALINQANEIIEQYQAQGLRMSLRQLYYRLVAANIIPNAERSYKNLSNIISDGRLAGLIDWDAIEDRVRVPRMSSEWDSIKDLVDSALASYRLPRWKGQENHVELWVEKDAISNVLSPLTREFHVTLMVNRGYSSQSAMYESAQRFRANDTIDSGEREGESRNAILLYLGDHDPSGEDMVRDVESRLEMFGVENLTVKKIALTTAQVRQYNPPPNPAKITDPRAADYIAQHGPSSWEVDALPPDVLAQIVREELEAVTDMDLMNEVKEQEKLDKKELLKAVEKIMKKRGA